MIDETIFIETREHRRFHEFCEDCRRHRYIGVCHGPPGIGKTRSARQYAHWDEIESLPAHASTGLTVSDAVLDAYATYYSVPTLSHPSGTDKAIANRRRRLQMLHRRSKRLMDRMEAALEDARQRDRIEREAYYARGQDWRVDSFWFYPRSEPTWQQLVEERCKQHDTIKDPTELIIIDEADRLNLRTLEQIRDIFDEGEVGLILIGMPGLEKKLARYPQLYSRIGFIHEYGLLSEKATRSLLYEKWLPPDADLPEGVFTDEEGIASIIRVAQGNFRRLVMLLLQVARILALNAGQSVVTTEVVNAARAGLIVGMT